MFCYKCFSVVCFDVFVGFVDVSALWMCMLVQAVHYGRCPKNTRHLSVASISRLPDLLLNFWRFAECFGRFRRYHEVDRNLVSRNMRSIFLQISSQGYWFSFEFLLFLWFSCDNFYLFLLLFTYSPKLEKQIHACSTDLSGSFSWKRKAHASC